MLENEFQRGIGTAATALAWHASTLETQGCESPILHHKVRLFYGPVVITVAQDVRNVSVRIRLSAGPPVFKLVDSLMERFVHNEETCVRFAARSPV